MATIAGCGAPAIYCYMSFSLSESLESLQADLAKPNLAFATR